VNRVTSVWSPGVGGSEAAGVLAPAVCVQSRYELLKRAVRPTGDAAEGEEKVQGAGGHSAGLTHEGRGQLGRAPGHVVAGYSASPPVGVDDARAEGRQPLLRAPLERRDNHPSPTLSSKGRAFE
jgi:hypothetical protein